MSCLKPSGCVILQWVKDHNKGSKLDPFAATLGEYVDMIYNMNINIDTIQRLPVATQGWMIVLTNDNSKYKY